MTGGVVLFPKPFSSRKERREVLAADKMSSRTRSLKPWISSRRRSRVLSCVHWNSCTHTQATGRGGMQRRETVRPKRHPGTATNIQHVATQDFTTQQAATQHNTKQLTVTQHNAAQQEGIHAQAATHHITSHRNTKTRRTSSVYVHPGSRWYTECPLTSEHSTRRCSSAGRSVALARNRLARNASRHVFMCFHRMFRFHSVNTFQRRYLRKKGSWGAGERVQAVREAG